MEKKCMYKTLIVDDERMIRMGISIAVPWERMGITSVFIAASGQEAFRILKKEVPDIMITDIRMTEMTGLELIAKIREINKDIRIIVLTGYDSFDYARECLRMKVDEFLLKPVDEELLIASIQRLVDLLEAKKQDQIKEKQLRRILGTTEQMNLERILNDFIYEQSTGVEVFESLKNDYHYDVMASMRIAILLPVLHFNGKVNDENDFFTMMNIKNLLIDFLDARGYGITFENLEGQLIIVLFEQERSDGLETIINDFIKIIQAEYDVATKVVLGSKVKGFAQLYISYNEALLLLGQQKDCYKTVLERRGPKTRLEMFREIYHELKNVMEANIGNTEKVIKAFDTVCAAMDSYNISDGYVRKCCFEIASSVYFAFIIDSGGNNVGNKINSLLNAIVNSQRKESCELTKTFLANLLESQEEIEHEIIREAKRYILQNISEDITVSSIAARFYITSNYFSSLFKRVMGEGCNEYIVRKRIEQAKSLLETTNINTGEIAQKVGYQGINYFSLAFKKHTGVSPTQYRRIIRER